MTLRRTRLLALLLALALALPAAVPAAPGAAQDQQPASGEWADVEKRLQENHEAMLKAVKASPTPLEGWWRSQTPDSSGLPLVQFQGQAFRYLIHEDFALGGTFTLNGNVVSMRGELLDEGGADCDEGPWHETMTYAIKGDKLTLSSEKDGDAVFTRLAGDPFEGQDGQGAQGRAGSRKAK
ncbi:MAG: hypothetical protein IKX75_03970 [Desulfovibrio sp.]|nr:hypothetical protein [Desulfovibrio sp.]